MPFTHEVQHDTRLVVIRGNGSGSRADGLESYGRLMNDRSLRPSYRLMIVLDEVDEPDDPPDVQDIATLIRALKPRFHGRKAIVTARTGRVATAIMVALSASTDGDVEAFTTEAAARRWLDA